MKRQLQLSRLAAFAGLAVGGVLAMSAAPAGATIVCPKGIQPPSPYCTDVPPLAKTQPATKITSTSALLNGRAGPGVRGGDITQYFFQYGTTTSYDNQTPLGTVGQCPPGLALRPYCTVPKAERVSAYISGLTPCTTYHFSIVAQNSDGVAEGDDETFTTDCRHHHGGHRHHHDHDHDGWGWFFPDGFGAGRW